MAAMNQASRFLVYLMVCAIAAGCTAEAGAEQMEKFKVWDSGLGDAVVNPGTPLRGSKIVGSDGASDNGGSNPLTQT